MAACVISGTVVDPSGTAISGATVTFKILTGATNSSSTTFTVPKQVSTTTASDGTWSLTVAQGLSGVISIDYNPTTSSASQKLNYSVIAPATATATFNSLLTET